MICSPDPVRIRLGGSGRSTPQKSISLLSSVYRGIVPNGSPLVASTEDSVQEFFV